VTDKNIADQLAAIAKRLLDVPTLETRNSDALDFHSLAVWNIRLALESAFELGRKSKEKK
jgi:acyl carrier protein